MAVKIAFALLMYVVHLWPSIFRTGVTSRSKNLY